MMPRVVAVLDVVAGKGPERVVAGTTPKPNDEDE